MSEFPKLEYSNRDVIRAGEALEGEIFWSKEREADIRQTFSVANSWRASHAFPMHRMRAQLQGHMTAQKLDGITAARLKQMPSIRAKLRRLSSNLRQLQDLGGCRAVLMNVEQAKELVETIKLRFKHELKREDSYMDSPRVSGYRSHHLVFAFEPRSLDEEHFRGRRIEVQVRTRLQHSWATAVEAVGLYRREHLKASEGNSDWLRLFELMSQEFAYAEGDVSASDRHRAEEIRELSDSLDAIKELDALSHAAMGLEQSLTPLWGRPQYCRIEYNHAERSVHVRYFDQPSKISEAYGNIEQANAGEGDGSRTILLIELDKIENLMMAYPNYFGDVQLFRKNLRALAKGKDAKEYSMPPIQRVAVNREIPDDSWIRQRRRYQRWS